MKNKIYMFLFGLSIVATFVGARNNITWLSVSGYTGIAVILLLVAIALLLSEKPKKNLPPQTCPKCRVRWEMSMLESWDDGEGIPWYKCPKCKVNHVVCEHPQNVPKVALS